jgi:hypothetical protein
VASASAPSAQLDRSLSESSKEAEERAQRPRCLQVDHLLQRVVLCPDDRLDLTSLSLSQVQDLGLTSTQAALEHRNVVLSLLGVRGSNVSSSAAAGACGSLGTRIVTGCSARLFLTARLVWCQWTLAIFREKRHPLP